MVQWLRLYAASAGGMGLIPGPGGSDSSLPTMQETQVSSLARKDPLEKEMATYSRILAWEILTVKPGGLQSMGLQKR